MTGRGTSGSWQIRGVQLGREMGARTVPDALDVAAFDLAVVVKRPTTGLTDRLHRARVPVVWDVVDAWPQPHGNLWDEITCIAWLTEQVQKIRPDGLVAATSAMASDCARFGIPVLWLPHHARPAQRSNPIREVMSVVGYEGGPQYLGRWRYVLENYCTEHKLKFIVNPDQLSDLDVVVALREDGGYAPRFWKSNVKLANAQSTGTPFIGSPEAGYMELATGSEFWVENDFDLVRALDAMKSYGSRLALSKQLVSGTRTLEVTAKEYKRWLLSNF